MKTLITGAKGYIGTLLIDHLLAKGESDLQIIGTDIKANTTEGKRHNYTYLQGDLRTQDVATIIVEQRPEIVVHLAAVVVRPKGMSRETIYEIEVSGTKKILEACVQAKVRKFITTSSGAAYGYHADNPTYLKEEDALRGNEEFAYAWHKRLVEEMLAEYRIAHPSLQQLILRVSTVMGKGTANDITNLFEKKMVMGFRGYDTPFVIIWEEDLVEILAKGILENKEGIFNVAGDGILTLREMAGLLGKRYIAVPVSLVKFILFVGQPLGLVRYGPEQAKFLQFRPVLENTKLKQAFGFIPSKTSKEAFLSWVERTDEFIKRAN